MIESPLHIAAYSRGMIVEQLMHVYGASQPNPLAFRQWLDRLSDAGLQKEYDKLLDLFEED